eukprot:CAMPEP_0181235812 /NCGR_PEP_ID=MMETSP1096-20121128/37795_1 /TAXON_ID=156174 ORGANISM="Chrysochromulina ericina, Strain CCMP281" /NCGR_SAMPLE_ID=MMETSP1096 /ASSEMBLY_ACC=CAM_ASM_000453 /LENGTH=43 /DNA_ID= /DNA_START= /DNA_END= /DNA_ORIENTATION=
MTRVRRAPGSGSRGMALAMVSLMKSGAASTAAAQPCSRNEGSR